MEREIERERERERPPQDLVSQCKRLGELLKGAGNLDGQWGRSLRPATMIAQIVIVI